MEKRKVKRVLAVCEPHLVPGEQAVHVCAAGIVPNSQRHKAVNAASAAVGAATALTVGVGVVGVQMPQRYCLVLTDRRLIFIQQNMRTAQPTDHVAYVLPRAGLRATRVRSFPSGKLALVDPDGNTICVLFFPLGIRLDGTNLLKKLSPST